MSRRQRFFNTKETLHKVSSNSGDKDFFDGDQSEFEVYEPSNSESDESADKSVNAASYSGKKNDAQSAVKSSDSEVDNAGDRGNRVNHAQQRLARQQQAPLVWRMAHGTIPDDVQFTARNFSTTAKNQASWSMSRLNHKLFNTEFNLGFGLPCSDTFVTVFISH